MRDRVSRLPRKLHGDGNRRSPADRYIRRIDSSLKRSLDGRQETATFIATFAKPRACERERGEEFEKHWPAPADASPPFFVLHGMEDPGADARRQEGSLHLRYGDSPCVAKLRMRVCTRDVHPLRISFRISARVIYITMALERPRVDASSDDAHARFAHACACPGKFTTTVGPKRYGSSINSAMLQLRINYVSRTYSAVGVGRVIIVNHLSAALSRDCPLSSRRYGIRVSSVDLSIRASDDEPSNSSTPSELYVRSQTRYLAVSLGVVRYSIRAASNRHANLHEIVCTHIHIRANNVAQFE